MCGEIASDPIGAVVLMGLGIDELSVHPSDIPFIREIVTRVEYKKAKELAKRVLEMNNSREVKEEARIFIKKYVPKVAEIMLE